MVEKIIKNILIIALLTGFFYACKSKETNNNSPVDPRSKFVGTWLCNETTHLLGNSTYSVTISLNPNNSAQILIANMYQLSTTHQAYGIVANSSVTIPVQNVAWCSINGSGTMINSSQIKWNYYISGSVVDTCTAIYTK